MPDPDHLLPDLQTAHGGQLQRRVLAGGQEQDGEVGVPPRAHGADGKLARVGRSHQDPAALRHDMVAGRHQAAPVEHDAAALPVRDHHADDGRQHPPIEVRKIADTR